MANRTRKASAISTRSLHRRLSESQGAATLWGVLATLVLVLVAAAVLDVYRLSVTRDWAYQVASDAALRGVSRGRDFASLTQSGSMWLDEAVAAQEARSAAEAALAEKGFSDYALDVRVLPEGGVEPGFPPAPRASQTGAADWSSPAPAVGVYLEVSVPVAFFGWVNGADRVPVRAFAAAALAELR